MNREDFAEFGGSLTANVLEFHPDAIPRPDTLHISMTRGERRIADELRKSFGGFKRVIIDVDGEQHEFSADSLIRLLEGYEGAHGTRWHELFGTPERAARTLARACNECDENLPCSECPLSPIVGSNVYEPEILDWLRGDA